MTIHLEMGRRHLLDILRAASNAKPTQLPEPTAADSSDQQRTVTPSPCSLLAKGHVCLHRSMR